MIAPRRRVLFIGESVALAHVSRPTVLARYLDTDRYEVHIAFDERHAWLSDDVPGSTYHPLPSISPEQFLTTPAGRAYSRADLEGYLRNEVNLLETIRPDLAVSDFRYTAPSSTALTETPHAVLVNAHWSASRELGFEPYPTGHRTVADRLRRSIPGRAVRRATRIARASAIQKAPDDVALVNEVRDAYRLPPHAGYLQMLNDADYVLHPEPAGLVGLSDQHPTATFIGNVTWSPSAPLPAAVSALSAGEELIYFTPGSTGDVSGLEAVLRSIAALGTTVVVASAGRFEFSGLPGNVILERIVPGAEVCARASVVVCSGGSATGYQAIAAGTPIVALHSNLDQFITSEIICRHGAGLATSFQTSPSEIAALVTEVLRRRTFRASAERLGALFDATRASKEFPRFVDGVLGSEFSHRG